MKKQNDGSDIYAPGKTCESAAKDIAKLCKCKSGGSLRRQPE
jgi:hypothetical protein